MENINIIQSVDQEAVVTHVQSMKGLLTTHNSLVGDVKSLLKALAKVCCFYRIHCLIQLCLLYMFFLSFSI